MIGLHHVELSRVDDLAAAAAGHGWSPLFADRYPHAGGPDRYAAFWPTGTATRWNLWRRSALVPVLLLAACSASGPPWSSVELPGGPGTVRDVTACDSHWYAVGGSAGRPVAASSPDGRRWTPVPVTSSSPYGRISVLLSVACAGDRLVAVGAASGGAHGNPRTATWTGDAHGLVEVPADFELYGGPAAVSVGRVVAGREPGSGNSAGPPRFLITGSRLSPRTGLAGGAVWHSTDGSAFTLVDDAFAGTTDGAVGVPGGWLAVGSDPADPATPRPAAWHSADGSTWQPESVTGTDAALSRAVPWHGGVLAVGVRGRRFGAWTRDTEGRWRERGSFGAFAGTLLPAITGLVATSRAVYAAGSDGTAFHLWRTATGDTWSEVELPAPWAAKTERHMALAATGDHVLLVADDSAAARLWLTS